MKVILTIIILICGLVGFFPTYGQENGDLQYNNDLNRIEIYLDYDEQHLIWTDDADDSLAIGVTYITVQEWCDLDSLRQTTPDGYFYYSWGVIDLNQIEYFKKLFNTFMDERLDKTIN